MVCAVNGFLSIKAPRLQLTQTTKKNTLHTQWLACTRDTSRSSPKDSQLPASGWPMDIVGKKLDPKNLVPDIW